MQLNHRSTKPHRVDVIFGLDAVDAYNAGQTSTAALRRCGTVKYYEFTTVFELNAFVLGIEEAQGALDALAVDDLST